ncbi:hypothetical protein Vadar_027341 [Vaccinium darrowii]|uniref:Uncharacterized protein n=1 Tax=Vaccinium darrowii TaxID=229202 RepID=A0ACB7Y924_9ERIC|nr:hypothetical protein Vadar_027341 [Vaccinium darrowii]
MTTTPVIVSGEHDDVPIYFRVDRMDEEGVTELYWCVIKTKTDCCEGRKCACKKVSHPVFKQEPPHRVYSGCVAVGGTLYVLGGREPPSSSIRRRVANNKKVFHPLSPPHCDVFYMDTTTTTTPVCCSEEEVGVVSVVGWKKLDHSMNLPRSSPYAFTVDGKIYVMGGCHPSPKPEVLDTRRMDEGWRELQDSTDVPGRIDGHAVIDGGKRIVVQSGIAPHLYCYDVEADSWKMYREDVLGYRIRKPGFLVLDWKSAFLDGILYYLDENRPGVVFGLDVSDETTAAAEPKRVRLPSGKFKCEDWGWPWIPPSFPDDSDLVSPEAHLVSLGSGKLVVLWSTRVRQEVSFEVHVYCSTIKISKEEKKQEEGGGDFDLVALPLSLSHVLVHADSLIDCLAVFPSQTMGPQEDVNKDDNAISAPEDVCQDDSTVSANHKNSTCGNKKKNGSEMNMKEKGENEGE